MSGVDTSDLLEELFRVYGYLVTFDVEHDTALVVCPQTKAPLGRIKGNPARYEPIHEDARADVVVQKWGEIVADAIPDALNPDGELLAKLLRDEGYTVSSPEAGVALVRLRADVVGRIHTDGSFDNVRLGSKRLGAILGKWSVAKEAREILAGPQGTEAPDLGDPCGPFDEAKALGAGRKPDAYFANYVAEQQAKKRR